ncbi:HotDog domain-containing protein [Microdochium bolleyi]|uniref:HotDog domain-containing protein n=1 Tax=Microdochium bolleyi TaxID=196109 RepID=A0A136IYZ6_9PEZI|nr:HotDog domain-containing protein [Microdochium bolleyi]
MYDNEDEIAMADAAGTAAASKQAADIAYLRDSAPWCAHVLDDAAFSHALTPSRTVKGGIGDMFVAETMATADTIPRWVTMFRRHDGAIVQTRTLLQVEEKVNGWPGVAHGGMTSFLLDECSALLLRLRRFVDKDAALLPAGSVTAGLNVSFKGQVPAPGVLLVTATLRRIEGRKYFVDAEITAGGSSVVLASSAAVFVAVKAKL